MQSAITSIFCLYLVLLIINFTCTTEVIKIPNNFSIGAGNSAFQVEGRNNINNTESFLEEYYYGFNNTAKMSNFYYKYKEDIQIAKRIGLQHFRMSLSWTRILPNGSNTNISQDGLQFYHNIIDEIRANGMEPLVTIFHWDYPKNLGYDAWLKNNMIDLFVNYTEIVFKNFGSKVKLWTTINEINIYCQHFSLKKYKCAYKMLKAHAKVYHLYNEKFRADQGGKIGMSNACRAFLPFDSDSSNCSFIEFEKACGWIYNPIFSKNGGWPEFIELLNRTSMIQVPSFTLEEIQYIKNTSDYFGLTYYTSYKCISAPNSNFSTAISLQTETTNKTWESEAGSFIYSVPEGLRLLLKLIKDKYNNPLVYILENGCPNDQNLNDVRKIKYLYSHIKEVILARNVDGCNIEKYTIWSFLDGFEWRNDINPRWGLIEVDVDSGNFTRTPRLSARWLAKILKDRELVEYYDGMELPVVN